MTFLEGKNKQNMVLNKKRFSPFSFMLQCPSSQGFQTIFVELKRDDPFYAVLTCELTN